MSGIRAWDSSVAVHGKHDVVSVLVQGFEDVLSNDLGVLERIVERLCGADGSRVDVDIRIAVLLEDVADFKERIWVVPL